MNLNSAPSLRFTFKLRSLFSSSLGSNIHKADSGLLFKTDSTLLSDSTLALFIKDTGNKNGTYYFQVKAGSHGNEAANQVGNEMKRFQMRASPVYDSTSRSLEILAPKDVLCNVGLVSGTAWQNPDLKLPDAGPPIIVQPDKPSRSVALSDIDITTPTSARKAMVILGAALEDVDTERTQLSKVQTQLDSAMKTLSHSPGENSDIPGSQEAEHTTQTTTGQMQAQVISTVISQARGIPEFTSALEENKRPSS